MNPNPRLDAVCIELRRLIPLSGWKRGIYMFMQAAPRRKGFHVRLTEWRSNRSSHGIDGPYDSWSFYVRAPEDVEQKLRERLLA